MSPRLPAVDFAVRVKPGSSRTHAGGVHAGARGPALVVAVAARAVDGAATEAVLRTLADALAVRRSTVEVLSGHRARDKMVGWFPANPSVAMVAAFVERLEAARAEDSAANSK